jgi:hypothetical protein
VAFVELRLGELAKDPVRGSVGDLPYDNIDHLRSCLEQVGGKEVAVKVVDRLHPGSFAYRTIKNGLFVGNQRDGVALYPLPVATTLKSLHYSWWKSANM